MAHAGSSAAEPLAKTEIDGDNATYAVVRAVATAAEESVTSLPPLSESIDPEALSAVVDSVTDRGSVRFEYDGYRIVVAAGGSVSVYPA